MSAKRLKKRTLKRVAKKRLRSTQRYSAELHDSMCKKNVIMDYYRRPEDYIR